MVQVVARHLVRSSRQRARDSISSRLNRLGRHFMSRALVRFLGGALFFASSVALVSLSVDPASRTRALAYLGCGGFFGLVISAPFGDALFAEMSRSTNTFRMMFCMMTIFCGSAAFLVANINPHITIPSTKPFSWRTSYHFLEHCVAFWPGVMMLVCLAFGICMTIPFVFLSRFADKASISGTLSTYHLFGKEFPITLVGLYFIVYGGCAIASRLLFPNPDRWFGRTAAIVLGLLLMAGGCVSYFWVDITHKWVLLAGAVASSVGHALVFQLMMIGVLEAFPKERQGTGAVLAYIGVDAGMIAASPVLGQLIVAFGFRTMYASVAGVCVLVALVVLINARNRARRLRELPVDSSAMSRASVMRCPKTRVHAKEFEKFSQPTFCRTRFCDTLMSLLGNSSPKRM